ncbi:hypothetical protein BU16DRAFT_580587 [Lophium mytilinum]|uniref:Uncharacterized protein n=1 Tax=Lophium mytilinum TaxID=390894 RepID=A0A6A6R1E3_9PEZI|nr:hypothetical protein BU16DRAFT_580587 [Lophium mytilinum]
MRHILPPSHSIRTRDKAVTATTMQYPYSPQTPPFSAQSFGRSLFDSPFSDYGTEPSHSPDVSLSPAQKLILNRLTLIGHQILRKDISKERMRLLSERLDAVDGVVHAPETQSRSELEDSALFIDSDDDEAMDIASGLGLSGNTLYDSKDAKKDDRKDNGGGEELGCRTEWEEGSTLGDVEADHNLDDVFYTPVRKSFSRLSRPPPATSVAEEGTVDEILASIAEVCMRHQETKYLNSLMLEELDVANAENTTLRNLNDKLILDLHLDYSELLFLKVQLQTIETHALPLEDEDSEFSFVRAIERLELNWRDVEKHLATRMETHGQDKYAEKLRATLPRDLRESLRRARSVSPIRPPNDILERLSRASTRSNSRTRADSAASATSIVDIANSVVDSTLGPVESIEEADHDEAANLHEATDLPEADEEDDGEELDEQAEQESSRPAIGFWDALARAAGIVDYYDLLADNDDTST